MTKKTQTDSFTSLENLGEFGLIDRIKSHTTPLRHPNHLLGIGDDAAIIDTHIDTQQQQMLISTDMLVEGIHFNLSYMPLAHLGYKAIVVNLSDIVAMNTIPTGVTVSIALSNRFSVEAVDALYQGIHAACEDYKIDLLGGDTCSSPSGLTISITAIGLSPPEKVVKRAGAEANQILCVTGDLGAAYMGLQILEREYSVFKKDNNMKPELEAHSYVVGRQLKPQARTDIIHELKERKIIPTSMIDISDGLASEALHLAQHNQLGIRIYEENIPIAPDTFKEVAAFNLSPLTCALNGGEDYELLFSVKQSELKKVEAIPDVTVIGHYTADATEKLLVNNARQGIPLQAQGWRHFSSPPK